MPGPYRTHMLTLASFSIQCPSYDYPRGPDRLTDPTKDCAFAHRQSFLQQNLRQLQICTHVCPTLSGRLRHSSDLKAEVTHALEAQHALESHTSQWNRRIRKSHAGELKMERNPAFHGLFMKYGRVYKLATLSILKDPRKMYETA